MRRNIFILIVLALLFSACGKTEDRLNIYNWGDYIDEEILSDFEEEYGIEINYETYGSNEDLYVKLKNARGAYDVVFPSEYMASKMIKEGLLYKFDANSLENFKNLDDSFISKEYDKDNLYTVPYFWGTMGILYNKDYVSDEDARSFKCLFDGKYKEQIFLFDAQRDVLGAGLKYLGYSLNTKNIDELNEARDLMTAQKNDLLAYLNDNMKTMILTEEGVLGYTDSGAAFSVISEGGEDKFGYQIPVEGSNLWIDLMAIPASSRHKEEAKLFINYLCDRAVAKKNTEYIEYATPLKLDDDFVEDKDTTWYKYLPSKEEISRCEVYTDLGDFVSHYNDAWIHIKAHNVK